MRGRRVYADNVSRSNREFRSMMRCARINEPVKRIKRTAARHNERRDRVHEAYGESTVTSGKAGTFGDHVTRFGQPANARWQNLIGNLIEPHRNSDHLVMI
jgi:hypothetical protein